MESQTMHNTPVQLDFDEEHSCATPETNDANTPKIGMEFESEKFAYHFYNNYAKQKGFGIKRDWVNHSAVTGMITSRRFSCCKEGLRSKNSSVIAKRPRKETRTGCLAYMTISLQPNNQYVVTKFEDEHNHPLANQSEAHLFRSQRGISGKQSIEIDCAAKTGLNPKETYDFMSRQAGGRENLGFVRIDLQNYLSSKRQYDMELGEAGSLLQYFQKKQAENPSFYYSVQLDQCEQITNIFWCDSKMRLDYEQFGDVISFDTTYKINRENRPFAPFVGVNNHKETVIFGAALLYDETEKSFKWLFESFLQAMNGVEPKTIITDQDHAMRCAISNVFEGTKHRLCVWHLYQNSVKHLSHVYKSSSSFTQDFTRCIYDFEEEEEFLQAWENMLDKYNLREDSWLKRTFKEREKWALVYGRHTFCADMKSTQLSECFNATLKRYLSSKLDVPRFFEHFERVLDDIRHKELVSNFEMTQKIPRLKVDAILLRQARDVYTSKVFDWFQNEFEQATNLVIKKIEENGDITVYNIGMYDKNREHIVTFNSLEDIIVCSCSKFEFVGILCSHVLKVFERKDIKIIPSKYVLKRWTKEATTKVAKAYEKPAECDIPRLALLSRYKDLSKEANYLAELASHSDEDYEYLKRVFEEARSKLGNKSKIIQESNVVRAGITQQKSLGEEKNPIQAKGLKRKEKGVRGRGRLKSGLEINSNKKKKNQAKVNKNVSSTASDPEVNTGNLIASGINNENLTQTHLGISQGINGIGYTPAYPTSISHTHFGISQGITGMEYTPAYPTSIHAFAPPPIMQTMNGERDPHNTRLPDANCPDLAQSDPNLSESGNVGTAFSVPYFRHM